MIKEIVQELDDQAFIPDETFDDALIGFVERINTSMLCYDSEKLDDDTFTDKRVALLIRDYSRDDLDEGTIVFSDLDDSIEGIINHDGKTILCYNYESLVRIHMDHGLSETDAREYVDFNIVNFYYTDRSPFIFHPKRAI